jgi:acetyl-CoA carboxylase carboxyl transferase subunit alpha
MMDFEKPLTAIQEKIEELVTLSKQTGVTLEADITRLRDQAEDLKIKLYQHMTPAQKLQVARHAQRPNFLEIVQLISPETWFELHGDRCGADDRAIVGGLVTLDGRTVMVVGTQKGRGMKENLTYNFGMANPEGYRKALRLFQHAEKFRMPIVTFIDTPGAYPGMHGEQHNIGQAIAFNIREMARMRVPIISVVLGEASSGGALGIGVANRIYMMEHALYTVISPEGCASILWRSAEYASRAAEALRITAQDLLEMGIIDGIIEEPLGGNHTNPELCGERLTHTLRQALADLRTLDGERLIEQRYQKYRHIGAFTEPVPV